MLYCVLRFHSSAEGTGHSFLGIFESYDLAEIAVLEILDCEGLMDTYDKVMGSYQCVDKECQLYDCDCDEYQIHKVELNEKCEIY